MKLLIGAVKEDCCVGIITALLFIGSVAAQQELEALPWCRYCCLEGTLNILLPPLTSKGLQSIWGRNNIERRKNMRERAKAFLRGGIKTLSFPFKGYSNSFINKKLTKARKVAARCNTKNSHATYLKPSRSLDSLPQSALHLHVLLLLPVKMCSPPLSKSFEIMFY